MRRIEDKSYREGGRGNSTQEVKEEELEDEELDTLHELHDHRSGY